MTIQEKLRGALFGFLKHYFNPMTKRLARSSFGPFAIIRHVGRRSGKQYETPIILGHLDGCFVIELTYGPDVDWYKNVVAAGGCTVIRRGKEYIINKLEPLDAERGRSAFPLPARIILQLLRREHFVKLIEAAQ